MMKLNFILPFFPLKPGGGCKIMYEYANRFGEIDIIAKDGDTICFCEVKYRRDNGCGSALEAVGYSKQKKIISVARYYLMTHGLNEWTPCRFDVIAVDDDEVTVLKNAFEGSQ